MKNLSTQSLNLNQINWQVNKKEYLDFSPAMTNQEKLKDKENLSNSLFKLLEKDIPSSCFVLSTKSKITKSSSMEPQTSSIDPPETGK